MPRKFLAKLLAEEEYFRLSNTVKLYTCFACGRVGYLSNYKQKNLTFKSCI